MSVASAALWKQHKKKVQKQWLLLLLKQNELIQSHIWPTSPRHRVVLYRNAMQSCAIKLESSWLQIKIKVLSWINASLPDLFFDERWVRWRNLLLRASRDSNFLSYWTTWQPWTTSTCSCTVTFLRDRTWNVNAAVIKAAIMIYMFIISNYRALWRTLVNFFNWNSNWSQFLRGFYRGQITFPEVHLTDSNEKKRKKYK